jgi:hypothetical protein
VVKREGRRKSEEKATGGTLGQNTEIIQGRDGGGSDPSSLTPIGGFEIMNPPWTMSQWGSGAAGNQGQTGETTGVQSKDSKNRLAYFGGSSSLVTQAVTSSGFTFP